MKRTSASTLPLALFAVLLVPACRTAGPAMGPGAAKAPDPLKAYVGEVRLLRPGADKSRIRLDAKERPGSRCPVVAAVRSAVMEKGAARFALETLGMPRLGDRRSDCRRMQPQVELAITGLSSANAAEITSRVDAVLQTADAYLAASGVRFDLAAGKPPTDVASREVNANDGERSLARRVSAWPVPLVSVDVWYRDPSGRVRQEAEVEAEAVVGSDGRLSRGVVKTGLNEAHTSAIVRSMSFWRFRPATRPEGPVAARIALRPILHIY